MKGLNLYVNSPDLIGNKYGKLTVISKYGSIKNNVCWLCKCDCGNSKVVTTNNLTRGAVRSCGCLRGNGKSKERSKKGNIYDLTGEYGIGFTNKNNKEFYFDLDDYDKIKGYTWFIKKGSVFTHIKVNNKNKVLFMHRVLFQDIDGMVVDHINGIPYDNRKSNLRVATQSQNTQNKGMSKNNTSGYKGVQKHNDKWIAVIRVNYHDIYLGTFTDIQAAFNARKLAEEKYFGEFSRNQENIHNVIANYIN